MSGKVILEGLGVVFGIVVLLFFAGGCAATPSAALYQAIGTNKAAVDATTTLLQNGKVSKTDATSVLTGAVAGEGALHVWDAVNQTGNTSNITAAETAANQAMSAILQQLQLLQNKVPVTTQAVASAKPKFKAPLQAASVSSSDVISLVELAVELAPGIESWVNTLLNTTVITEPQITQAFTDLDTSIAALRAALGG